MFCCFYTVFVRMICLCKSSQCSAEASSAAPQRKTISRLAKLKFPRLHLEYLHRGEPPGAVRRVGAGRPHRHEPCGREADLRVRGGPRARGVQRRVGERVQLQLRQVLQGREAGE